MQSTSVPLTGWKRYKRYSDNIKLEARLIERADGKWMEVQESRAGNFVCPHCAQVISQGNAEEFPRTVLDPKTFHELHRPLDKD